MAEAFDEDPFLILAWRGRDKEQLLADLRARRRGPDAGEPDEHTPADVVEAGRFGWPSFDSERRITTRSADATSFWGDAEDLSTIETRPRSAVAADLVLRQLDPSTLGEVVSIIDELRPLYEGITARAIALALGEESTSPGS
jgi:uncharacterized Zn finger protein